MNNKEVVVKQSDDIARGCIKLFLKDKELDIIY
jgi:hypothetical protein